MMEAVCLASCSAYLTGSIYEYRVHALCVQPASYDSHHHNQGNIFHWVILVGEFDRLLLHLSTVAACTASACRNLQVPHRCWPSLTGA